MQLTNSIPVKASPDDVFTLMNDVERVASCMPGAALEGQDGDTWKGSVKVKVGPITASYSRHGPLPGSRLRAPPAARPRPRRRHTRKRRRGGRSRPRCAGRTRGRAAPARHGSGDPGQDRSVRQGGDRRRVGANPAAVRAEPGRSARSGPCRRATRTAVRGARCPFSHRSRRRTPRPHMRPLPLGSPNSTACPWCSAPPPPSTGCSAGRSRSVSSRAGSSAGCAPSHANCASCGGRCERGAVRTGHGTHLRPGGLRRACPARRPAA